MYYYILRIELLQHIIQTFLKIIYFKIKKLQKTLLFKNDLKCKIKFTISSHII